jgi:hypothetical protein
LTLIRAFLYDPSDFDVCGLLGFPRGELRPAVISRIGFKPEISMKTVIRAAIRCCLMFTAAVALSFAHPASANLITNGDFETGDFTGWTVTHADNGSNIFVANGPGPDTTFGAFFGATVALFDVISQHLTTIPGHFYTLTFFYQVLPTDLPPDNGFRVFFGGEPVFDNSNANPGFGMFTFNVEAIRDSTILEFDGFNTRSFDFLDNVSVTAVPDAGSTFSLLGFASLGLAALAAQIDSQSKFRSSPKFDAAANHRFQFSKPVSFSSGRTPNRVPRSVVL